MIKIIPAILTKTYDEFEIMVRKIEPYADLVHLDIADGEFVSNKTIDGYKELKKINTNLNFEIHLMIKNPESVIGRWLKTKAVRYLIHPESAGDLESLINQVKGSSRELGLVLNPEIDCSSIEPYLDKIDLVQFMTVDPGFYGSLFLPEVLEKIRNFHGRYPGKVIQVDGGINAKTIKLVETAGASRVAVGSHIFSEGKDVDEAIKELNV